MDVLKVVQQLRDLAADPQNRATIVRVSLLPSQPFCITYIMVHISIYSLSCGPVGCIHNCATCTTNIVRCLSELDT